MINGVFDKTIITLKDGNNIHIMRRWTHCNHIEFIPSVKKSVDFSFHTSEGEIGFPKFLSEVLMSNK